MHCVPDLHAGLQDHLDLGKGQEYMLWNNVETSRTVSTRWLGREAARQAGRQKWNGVRYEGHTVFEAAEGGERVHGWRPEDIDYAYRTSVRTTAPEPS